MRLAGAADLPPDLYPDSVPWVAFIRVLDAPRDGAEGMLHQQITPYSYVGQEVWARRLRTDHRAGRHLLRAEGNRKSRHHDGDAELATLRSASHQAGNSEKHAVLRGGAALSAAQAGRHDLRRRSGGHDGTGSLLHRRRAADRGSRRPAPPTACADRLRARRCINSQITDFPWSRSVSFCRHYRLLPSYASRRLLSDRPANGSTGEPAP